MNKIYRLFLGAFLCSFSLFSHGQESLKSGDIVLLPLSCRSCDVIASETGGTFSHSGIYLKARDGQEYVIEALGSVRAVHFENFVKRAPMDKKVGFVRVREFENLSNGEIFDMIMSKFSFYEGKGFDHNYLWNNVDENGDELYYCSEFVAKILNEVIVNKFQTTPMDFTTNWDYWYYAFNGNVPQGLPGNSPNDLYRDPLVRHLDLD